MLHCPREVGGGIYQQPKTLKPPKERKRKKKRKRTTFIQQPNLYSLLLFDGSCKTGNKYTQGQSIEGKKINCMRTIGEVHVASPLLLLDTNCLLISVPCIMEGRQHGISDSPKYRCKCQHGSFNNGTGPQTNQLRAYPHHLQQRLMLQTQNQTCVSARAGYYWGNVLTITYRRYSLSWHSWPALQIFPYCHADGNPK